MSPITSHVLNTTTGKPGSGIRVTIDQDISGSIGTNFTWRNIGETLTNSDGRCPGLLSQEAQASFSLGVYRLIFWTQDYFESKGESTFYPYVEIVFRITDLKQHYHVPLLISAYGYSTYRGS